MNFFTSTRGLCRASYLRFAAFGLILGGISCVPQPLWAQSQARKLVDETIHAIDHVITVEGTIKRNERVKGVMEPGELHFKLMMQPYKLYVYNFAPDVGAELLYVKGWNDNQVLVHPNKFPWVNISLAPHSAELTKSGHHPLTCIGFSYTAGILRDLIAKHGAEFDQYVKYEGLQKWMGKDTHVIKVNYLDYAYTTYTVKAGEDIFDIDERLKIPAYRIMELNANLKKYQDLKAGDVIKVPNNYAKEIVMMIDPTTHLPVVQLIFDDRGLFEKYEYSQLRINPRFTTNDFLEDNEAYGF